MGYDEASDEDLAAAVAGAPDPDTRRQLADELFARHYERVARWCYRFTGDRDAAADVAQNVFIKAYRHLDGFRGTARFSTWLYAIVRNEAFASLRETRREPAAADEEALVDVPAAGDDPERETVRSSQGAYAHRLLLQTLDATERAVFVLHYGDGLPLDAITRALGLQNTSGAKAHIVSAKRKLARALPRIAARGGRL